ncbi:MAG TPA: bifunctional NUDIX hydrolase/histidine phosphatase family protein [Dehalococcoidia bacterium]|nr:bifunctional NUDIX hydrolase/histidine phosphatase family protein [Dehalococcoidia bacterium]
MVERVGASVIRAAGGVLWRTANSSTGDPRIEVAIIHRPRYDDWSIPKGKLVPGESELEGAIREVTEETGYRVQIRRPLGEVSYEKGSGAEPRLKTVRYWSMHAEGGLFSPSREVDQLRWLSVDEAMELLSQGRDRELLRTFAAGPILTRSTLLVRHGSAGNRSGWSGDDDLRPLDDSGVAQADGLVWLLTRFDVREIISAPPLRCVQTVEPLSAAVGLTIREESVISEDGYYGREDEAVAILREAGSEGTGTAVCSQGGVIPDVLGRLAAKDGVSLGDSVVAKKGSVWSLTFAGQKLVAAEYFPPLA